MKGSSEGDPAGSNSSRAAGLGSRGSADGAGLESLPALLAALKTAAGTAAYCGIAREIMADPVRYNNPPPGEPGHFSWTPDVGFPITLDVTKPADEQPGIPGLPGTFQQSFYFSPYLPKSSSDINANFPSNNEVLSGFGIRGLADSIPSGSVIGAKLPFDEDFGGVSSVVAYTYYDRITSEIPEGSQTYLAARWFLGDSTNIYFGWIGVVRQDVFIEPFAWGFETDAGVPIAAGEVPEPGTLEALAFGFGAALFSRRKEKPASPDQHAIGRGSQ